MKTSVILSAIAAFLLLSAAHSKADPPWTSGQTLYEVIGEDLQAHDKNQKLDSDQTAAVCLILGYLRGFAESSAIATHYNPCSLPYYLPDSMTGDEMERVIYTFLTKNQDKLEMNGDALIVAALSRSFPNTLFTPPSPSAQPTP
jgi:hypothetical protein